MDLVTGAMGSVLPKLVELLNNEYKLPKSVKKGVRSLEKEMQSMHAALHVVAEVPRDQLDEQVKLWAGEVRELSFDMEDVVDKFLVRVDDDPDPAARSNKLKRLTEKMAGLFTKGKARHQIADAIKDINKQVQEVANRRERYTIDNIVANPAAMTHIDPHLGALYTEVAQLVGIAGKRDQELMKLLSDGDSMSNKKLKIVSVVGFGGLGKTTLVKTVYDKIKGDFDCRAFVPVSRNADAKKILMDILLDLGMYESQFTILDERQLIDKLRESLENKRCAQVMEICRVCIQPRQNCGHSRRSAESFTIIMNQADFQNVVVIPCHFKERLNDFADKWLPTVATGHRFELFLVKREDSTYIRGPFWTSFLRSHNIALNDVVTFRLIKQDDEEGADDQEEEEEDEEEEDEEEEEDVQEENPVNRAVHVFRMVAHDPDGNIKDFQNVHGVTIPDVDPYIRETFYRSVFTDMHLITGTDMCSITFEMLKEVSKQKLLDEDEFFHLSDLQYFVTTLNAIDVVNNCLVMPLHIARGYKIPCNGTALFQSYGMDDAVGGEYTVFRGNINEIVFRNGWNIFCNINQLVVGSLIPVRVEFRKDCIGLFVTRIR